MYQANVRYQQGIVSMEAGVTKAKQGSKQGLGGGLKEARDWMWDEWMWDVARRWRPCQGVDSDSAVRLEAGQALGKGSRLGH